MDGYQSLKKSDSEDLMNGNSWNLLCTPIKKVPYMIRASGFENLAGSCARVCQLYASWRGQHNWGKLVRLTLGIDPAGHMEDTSIWKGKPLICHATRVRGLFWEKWLVPARAECHWRESYQCWSIYSVHRYDIKITFLNKAKLFMFYCIERERERKRDKTSVSKEWEVG